MTDKERLKEEIVRCGKEPAYFIRKYVKIKHPKRGLIDFRLFSYQEQLLADYQQHRFNVILKARQLGISEVTAAYACWMILFHKHKNVLVMATKAETAKNIIKKVATALKKLPKWMLLADIITDNKLSIELANGSQIKAIASSDDAGRSEAVSLLIIDEAAFIGNFEELWTGLLPTVTAGGSVVVLSTPNGVGNMFHKIYTEAENGENDFHATRLMWWLHPERVSDLEDDGDRPGFKTSSWYRNETQSANMSDRDIAQELECNFNASGETVISAHALRELLAGCLEPVEKKHWDRNLWVWWRPDPSKRYFLTVDVSRGDGKDYSAVHVWDYEMMEQQAEYYGRVPPEELATLVVDLGKEYGSGPLIVENNNVGLACLEHVRLAGYPAVYYSRRGDSRPGQLVNARWGTTEPDLVPGFTTSQKTRPLIVAKLEEYVRNRSCVVRSRRFYEELKTFIWVNGRGEAMRGRNDDLVMSAALGAWMKDTFLTPDQASASVHRTMVRTVSSFTTNNTQITGASKDPRHVPTRNMGAFSQKRGAPLRVSLPNGQVADFSWLLRDSVSKG